MAHPPAHRTPLRSPAVPRPTPARDGASVLVLQAHPTLHRSRVGRRLAAALRDRPGVTLHDLYESYPDQDIDVAHEQQLLLSHDVFVWLHPFYWYSTPPMLKAWQDLVLTFGWAYGPGGTQLRGKRFLQVLSTGGREDAYRPDGTNRYTIRQLLAPVDQTMFLCGVKPYAPFIVHGTHRLDVPAIDHHAADLVAVIDAIHTGRLRPEHTADLPRLNVDVPGLLGGVA